MSCLPDIVDLLASFFLDVFAFTLVVVGCSLLSLSLLLILRLCCTICCQFARPFGGSVCGFRQRLANWGSVLVRRFAASEGPTAGEF